MTPPTDTVTPDKMLYIKDLTRRLQCGELGQETILYLTQKEELFWPLLLAHVERVEAKAKHLEGCVEAAEREKQRIARERDRAQESLKEEEQSHTHSLSLSREIQRQLLEKESLCERALAKLKELGEWLVDFRDNETRYWRKVSRINRTENQKLWIEKCKGSAYAAGKSLQKLRSLMKEVK